ncbi:putative membrane protein [Cellulomonas sp. PhB143]|nr:putative membrane protein [Cellulomonas sp. PhB143]
MDPSLGVLVVLLAIVGSGVVAGVFFAFSAVVVPGLREGSPALGAAAMRAANRAAVRWPLMALLFGTGLLCLLAPFVVGAGNSSDGPVLGWVVAGSVLYLVGAIVVTVAGNVPLNRRLAALDVPGSREYWPRYAERWSARNDLRAAGSAAACLLLLVSLVV